MNESFDEPETAESVIAACAAGVHLAFAVTAIEEMPERIDPKPIANAPRHVAGVVELRGASVPVIDLASLLGQHTLVGDPEARSLVVVEHEQRLALLVSEVRGIIPVGVRRGLVPSSSRPSHPWITGEVDLAGEPYFEVGLPALFQAMKAAQPVGVV